MNEFEARLLEMIGEQNAVLKRLETAVGALGGEVAAVRRTLHDMGKRTNVVQLTRRVQHVEGEVSELQGRVARHDAEIGRMGLAAAGGSDGR